MLRKSLLAALSLVLTAACSSGSFDVAGQGTDASDDSTAPDTALADTALADTALADTALADTALADTASPDTMTALDGGGIDANKPDAVVSVDTGCAVGATIACECGGTRTCVSGGKWGECLDRCQPSPNRFICALGKNGCTKDYCFDSNNCIAQCQCDGPGAACRTSDACWGEVCRDYTCP